MRTSLREAVIISIGALVALALASAYAPGAGNAGRTAGTAAGTVTIRWCGQSSFLITTSVGTRILTDPAEFKGYRVPGDAAPDLVTVSHEHPDHNGVEAVPGNPEVLRGCTKDNQRVNEIDRTFRDVRVYTVSSWHDPGHHGKNAIFVLEFDGLRIAHLGDIGTTLTPDQVRAVGPVDILMIPVGGQFTVDAAGADEIVDQLGVKRIVFPMHYRTDAFDSLPYSAEPFLAGKKNVIRQKGNTFLLEPAHPPAEREYVVMEYR